jgi:hypothetical protein
MQTTEATRLTAAELRALEAKDPGLKARIERALKVAVGPNRHLVATHKGLRALADQVPLTKRERRAYEKANPGFAYKPRRVRGENIRLEAHDETVARFVAQLPGYVTDVPPAIIDAVYQADGYLPGQAMTNGKRAARFFSKPRQRVPTHLRGKAILLSGSVKAVLACGHEPPAGVEVAVAAMGF